MIIYTGGTFEVPHTGHVNFLRKCSQYGRVIVSLNTDEFIKSYKGFNPCFSYDERKKMLELIEYVDMVIPNEGGHDSKYSILKVNPDVIAIGQDWLSKDYCKQMGFTPQWLTDHNISLLYIPHTDGISTTEIKKRICSK